MTRALAIVMLLAARASAAPADYRLDSAAWNGLSRLADEASSLGCKMSAADELDWAALGAHDVVFVIYPLSPVDPQGVASFLQRGGKLLLADDFGSAEAAFAALELRRAPAHLEGVPRMTGHPDLPVAHARLLTELGRSVDELVANQPAVFDTALPATFAFSPGQALVVEGQVGKGRFVALSDPSILINNMLEVEGNRVFAHGLLASLCRTGADGDRVHVLTGAFRTRAVPPASTRDTGALARLNDVLDAINRAADELAPVMALPFSVLLCAAAAWLAWTGLRGRRFDRHLDGAFARAAHAVPVSSSALVMALPAEGDHAVPLMLLRAEVLRRLGVALGPIPASGPRRLLVSRAADRFGQDVARSLQLFFDTGPSLLDGTRRVSRRTFDRALELARPFLATAPVSEDKG